MSESSKNDAPVRERYGWRFWLVTLSALAMVVLTLSLGMWQLDRAAQKEKISLERREAQPISFSGQWLKDQTIYIDNRQMNAVQGNAVQGKPRQGFFVVTPLLLANNEFVLVERGWIARDFLDRKKLQPIDTPAGELTISAKRLADPVMPAVIADNSASEHPIVQYVDVQKLTKTLHSMAYKGYVQQQASASEGLLRNWHEPASGVDKHYGYAFQWFALCALLVGLYVWFQWIKK